MMGEASSVKLHGTWASPYAMRVQLALKIKGIEYEYIEEDLQKKSELLLRYNPIHKQVPVLVHNGLPIAESLVILDYIDATWSDPPHLLPKDPYSRAKHRFWVAYFPPVIDLIGITLKTEGEAQQKAMNELMEKLDVAENGMKEIFPNGIPSFQDENPQYFDMAMYPFFGMREAAAQVFGEKLLKPERHPQLASWVEALGRSPVVKDVMPPTPRLLNILHIIRQKALHSYA